MNETLPVWNSASIYPSLSCDEYKSDFEKILKLISDAKNLLETSNLNSESDCKKFADNYFPVMNEICGISKTLNAYAYIIYSTDTTNTDFINNLDKVSDLSIEIKQLNLKYNSFLLENQTVFLNFIKNSSEYNKYLYLTQLSLEEASHSMSADEEKLADKLSQTGGEAWSLLQEQIISNLNDGNGKTFNDLRADACSENPEIRKEAYTKEIALLKQNEIPLAAALNNLKGETLTLNEKRNWTSPLDKSLFSSRISKKTIEALTSAIEESLPVWRKYFIAKAKLLRKLNLTASTSAGINSSGLAFYDLFAPLSFKNENSDESLISKNWSFKETTDYIVEKFSNFSSDMGHFAEYAYKNNWVDAQVRKGKVGGAYDEDFPKGHQSRILVNFTGNFSDVITLAHETGHAYHFHCMKDQEKIFFEYPMTLAETASTFAETIVKQDMIKRVSGRDKLQIIEADLQDVTQVLVDILSRFYFESSVFEERKNGQLNAQDFCRLMADAQEKTYGSGLNSERHEYMWAVKSHYYITSFDFYNYPYAFGQLFASSLYQKGISAGSQEIFAENYIKLLSETGSSSCETLCQKYGFDITSKEFWLNSMKTYFDEVEIFCKEAEIL